MIVVADTSPLIALVNIRLIQLLPAVFGEIVVPSQVIAELRADNRPDDVRTFAKSPPNWLLERSPLIVEQIPKLDAGEIAAISLVKELRADLLLVDDLRARKAAAERSIPLMGTIGLLEEAANQGLTNLPEAFERLRNTDFWVSSEFLNERLALFSKGSQPSPGG